jgi:transcriptional regulator with XRE-family HTH domain
MKGKRVSGERPVIKDPSVNQRMTALRHSLKLTQIEFAQKILVSNGFIAGIELGKRKANDRLLRLTSITFGVNENWLRNGKGPMFAADKAPDYRISEALAAFEQLSPPLQDLVLEHIRKLLAYEKRIG